MTSEETAIFLEVATTDSLTAELHARGYVVVSQTAWRAIVDHIRKAYFSVGGQDESK